MLMLRRNIKQKVTPLVAQRNYINLLLMIDD